MKMKLLSALLLVCFGVAGFAQKPETADAVMKAAYTQAGKEGKNVFLLFHASWCGWCHKMDTAMNDPKVAAFFRDNYVIKHLTVYESPNKKALESPGAVDLLAQYNGTDQGIPYWIVLDKNGTWLADSQIRPEGVNFSTKGENTGCPANEKEVQHFIAVLRKTSKLKEEQLKRISERFRLNESH
jgi:thiol-disulfide isomerase/thioredoxin